MSDYAIVWKEQEKGPCVLCGEKTGVGAVGWHQANPVGPVCVACMLVHEEELGVVLRRARARSN